MYDRNYYFVIFLFPLQDCPWYFVLGKPWGLVSFCLPLTFEEAPNPRVHPLVQPSSLMGLHNFGRGAGQEGL